MKKLKYLFFLLLIISNLSCSREKETSNVYIQVGNTKKHLTKLEKAKLLQEEVFDYIKKNWTSRTGKTSDWFRVYSIRQGGNKTLKKTLDLEVEPPVVFSTTCSTSVFRIKEKNNGTCVIEKKNKDGSIEEQCLASSSDWPLIKAIARSSINLKILKNILEN